MTLRSLSKIFKMVKRLQAESDAATFQQSIPPLFSAFDRLTSRAVAYIQSQRVKNSA